jgi:hypothetical protein
MLSLKNFRMVLGKVNLNFEAMCYKWQNQLEVQILLERILLGWDWEQHTKFIYIKKT